ncbi:hypothetical protein AK812_SmicGene46865 [Symbiodinium microadriaticum]|uniref:Uncharacterized protein n=1 Tax=Symbiodinium microadriaticum TaxID=2951 RepID=A0A1Q9BT29_SYMMI|nr:hypothetical protein AK812_SmicGene46865 [Symbiodinium microadriaticum]
MWTASKELKVLAIPTETNPADAGTKVLTGARLKKLCGLMGMVDGSGNLIKDDTNHKAKAGNAIKVLMMVQALLATTQLEGCGNEGPEDPNYILDYLLESFYVFGYMLSMVGGGYLYVLTGIIVMTLIVYLVFGARWRVTFVLENRPYTSGLGPGYADGGSTSEGAPSSASREDAENDNADEDQSFEDTFGSEFEDTFGSEFEDIFSYSKFVEHFFGKGTCGFHFFDFNNEPNYADTSGEAAETTVARRRLFGR